MKTNKKRTQRHERIGCVINVFEERPNTQPPSFDNLIYAGEDVMKKVCSYLKDNHDNFVSYLEREFYKENNPRWKHLEHLCECKDTTHSKYPDIAEVISRKSAIVLELDNTRTKC